jgi:hypothetical protein
MVDKYSVRRLQLTLNRRRIHHACAVTQASFWRATTAAEGTRQSRHREGAMLAHPVRTVSMSHARWRHDTALSMQDMRILHRSNLSIRRLFERSHLPSRRILRSRPPLFLPATRRVIGRAGRSCDVVQWARNECGPQRPTRADLGKDGKPIGRFVVAFARDRGTPVIPVRIHRLDRYNPGTSTSAASP